MIAEVQKKKKWSTKNCVAFGWIGAIPRGDMKNFGLSDRGGKG